MNIIAIDNGVTGSITILEDGKLKFFGSIPIFKDLNYTKTKQFINRIDTEKLLKIFSEYVPFPNESIAVMERPMVNPMRFKSTTSALRALEAELICLKVYKIPYLFIDSKEWQKVMLPAGLKKGELKIASDQVAKRLFPEIEDKIKDGKGDSLLIARYYFQKYSMESKKRSNE